ncbi:MAG: SBBP repeat-containing protein, partial [Acidimicrobiales bacterium]
MGARTRRNFAMAVVAVVAAVAVALPLVAVVAGEPGQRRPAAPDAAAVLERLPLAFEENVGQLDPEIRFAARTPGQQVLLTDRGLVVSPAGVRLTLEGARPGAPAAGERPLPGTVNRFAGDDPSQWRTAIPTYGAVTYREVYPGIDVTYYGTGRLVEYDFVVAPGADPGVIVLGMAGQQGAHLDGSGALVMGDVRMRAPTLYQDGANGVRRPVQGSYAARGDGRFGFDIGPYDRSHPLVIDPVLVSSSYLGGTSTDTAYAVAVNVDGDIVVTGYTESPDFPTVSPAQGALVQADGTRTDVFVTKVKADGGTVLWSTYLGGRGRDAAFGVAMGPDGGVWLTGYAESSDFPTVRPLQPANGGTSDVFVARLNSAGSALDFSTFLGGAGADSGSGIAVDKSGAVYVVGSTGSANFPKVRPLQATLSRPDDIDGFILRLEPNGASLAWSTYLGGAGDDHTNDIALDGEGNVYVTGDTKSANFPTTRPFQAGPGGAGTGAAAGSFSDAFVAKVRPDGSALAYSSYLGGADSDKGTGIAVDGQGAAYVTGNTGSTNFPVAGAAQAKKDGDFDAFVTKVRPDGSGLAYSTYLGGTGSDGAEGIAVDAQGHAHVTGATASSNFPSTKAFQPAKGGGFVDAFVTEVGASGSSWASSSYLGGKDDDQAAAIALDSDGNPVVVGYTNSTDFPVIKPFQPGKGGGVGDGFIAKARDDAAADAANPAAAAERRDRRVRTLITVTGGLFLAAFLQSVWLRRRPETSPRPQP